MPVSGGASEEEDEYAYRDWRTVQRRVDAVVIFAEKLEREPF